MPFVETLSAAAARPGRAFCCLLVAGILFAPSALAERLTWQDGVREGKRRLEHRELVLAEGCFRQALRDVKKDKTSPADDVALCMQDLAQVLQMQDITDESESLYKKATKVLTRAHGPESTTLLPPLMALSDIFESEGQFKKAIKLDKQALEIAGNGPLAASLTMAACEHNLGRACFKNSQPTQAEPYYRSALALIMVQKNLPSSELLEALIADYSDLLEKNYGPGKNLASQVRSELLKDRLAELGQKRGVADASFEKEVSLRLARQAYGKIPVQELSAAPTTGLSAAADTLVLPALPAPVGIDDFAAKEGVGQQRIVFYERMIAVDIKTLGPEHPSVARDLSGLAAVYMAVSHYEEAKGLFMRALKIYEKVYGDDALLVKRTRTMLELVSENQIAEQNGDPAGSNFVAALPDVPLAAQKLDIAISLNYLAALCYSLGKVDDAEKIYAWAISDTYKATGAQSLLLAGALKDYARVLRSAGNIPRAEILEADARAIMRRALSQQAVSAYQ